ncbi:MAG TPA: gliding motility protein GldM [Flavisolibacter sp.]|nr:gliding motility protein GldM [Flavisolibacter sp.]
MALPAEPRQKMINLMYLVLTALLALNVSAEILNAFKTVERSLTTTNATINESTTTIMKSFQEKLGEPESAEKAKLWMPKAQSAITLTTDLNNYINGLKAEIMKQAGFDPAKNGDSTFKEDNQDIATRIMVEEGKGKELRAKLEAYKQAMVDLEKKGGGDANVIREIQYALKQIDLGIPPTKSSHGNNTWESAYFSMVPTVAATTMLSKFQNDIKTAENRVVATFHEQVGAVKVRYNKFAAIVGQNSNYLMPGQDLEISAGIGAFSTEALPQVTIAGQNLPINEEGMAIYKTKAAGQGTNSVTVNINYKDQEGKLQTVTKTVSYTVGQSNAAIALPEMNVLYIGYPNKIRVSGGGVGAEKINVSVSGGGGSAVKTGPGEFIVNVSQQTEDCNITASADGKTIGAVTYRVRSMPAPAATVGGKKSGDFVSAAAMSAQAGVGAYIENFPLNLKYTVTKFKVVGTDEEGNVTPMSCTGNAFTPGARNMIKNMKSGDILTIEDIYCTGPDGRSMKLPSLLYNIN